MNQPKNKFETIPAQKSTQIALILQQKPPMPLPNYTLSTVCPACGDATFRLACKVRCGRCGFMWDCSEL